MNSIILAVALYFSFLLLPQILRKLTKFHNLASLDTTLLKATAHRFINKWPTDHCSALFIKQQLLYSILYFSNMPVIFNFAGPALLSSAHLTCSLPRLFILSYVNSVSSSKVSSPAACCAALFVCLFVVFPLSCLPSAIALAIFVMISSIFL